MLRSLHRPIAMKLRRGLLIVLEGNDRAGKTTQAFKLVEAFRNAGQPARVISFPDRATEIGSVINDYLRGEIQLHDNAVHLLFAANRWEKFDEMLKDLHTGVTLIVDRYSYSGVAYSSAKKGANFGWCCAPENGLLQPDLVFFFSCNVDKLETREGFGEEAFETNQFQNAVRQSYMKMMEDNWVIIDASQSIEAVHKNIKDETFSRAEKITGEVGRINFEPSSSSS